jgi:hypothetical protein
MLLDVYGEIGRASMSVMPVPFRKPVAAANLPADACFIEFPQG